MKAVVYTEYGSPDVLHLTDVEKPAPKDNEVLVKVHTTTVGFGDLLARNMGAVTPGKFTMPFPLWLPTRLMFGFTKPKRQILGAEFAGEIEATGADVTGFKAGDPVFGYLGPNFGANAEYLCIRADGLVAIKPANMSYEEATTVPYGGVTALNLLRKVNVQPGQKVLINGASGSIGAAAVQLAKHHFGAEVTGVCGTPRMEFVKALGADHVIDYTQEDFTQNGETYDLILDVLGKSSFLHCTDSLTANGRYLRASFKMKHLFQMLWTRIRGGKRVICTLSMEKQDDLIFIRELVEAGKFKAVIDKRFPLAEVAEAHRYIEDGQKKGHVVITVADGS